MKTQKTQTHLHFAVITAVARVMAYQGEKEAPYHYTNITEVKDSSKINVYNIIKFTAVTVVAVSAVLLLTNSAAKQVQHVISESFSVDTTEIPVYGSLSETKKYALFLEFQKTYGKKVIYLMH